MCQLCGSELLLDYGVVEVCMSCGTVIDGAGVVAEEVQGD